MRPESMLQHAHPGRIHRRGSAAYPPVGEVPSEAKCEPIGIYKVCENPPNRSKHHAGDHISWIVCADVDAREPDQGGECIEAYSDPHPQLKTVDQQSCQEEYLGCMTTGKRIASFAPADDACLIESQEWALPFREHLDQFHQ